MNREDQEIEKINKRRVALINAASEIAGRGMAAEKRLAELRASLGEIVLRAAMCEIVADEPRKIRREMQDLREAIEDADLIIEPARRREARLNGDEHKLSAKRLRRQEYIALRQKLTDNPALASEPGVTVPLRELCAFLDGDTTDADAAITAARQAKAAA